MSRNKIKLLITMVCILKVAISLLGCSSLDNNNYDEKKLKVEGADNLDNIDIVDEDCDEDANEIDGRGEDLEPQRFTSGEFKGQYNPRDIRGSYTLSDISKYFEIPLSVLAKAYNLPEEEAKTFQNKNYKYLFEGLQGTGKEIGNGSIVFFVALYKGFPYVLNEPTYLLEPAVEILKELGTLSEDDLNYISQHTITIEEAGAIPIDEFVPPEEEEHGDEYTVDGKTTFKDLLDMGLSEKQILGIINTPMPELQTRLKDYCVEHNIPFTDTFKPAVLEMLYELY